MTTRTNANIASASHDSRAPFSSLPSLASAAIPMPVVTLASARRPPRARRGNNRTDERAAENDHRSIPDRFLRPTVICNIFLYSARVLASACAIAAYDDDGDGVAHCPRKEFQTRSQPLRGENTHKQICTRRRRHRHRHLHLLRAAPISLFPHTLLPPIFQLFILSPLNLSPFLSLSLSLPLSHSLSPITATLAV